MTNYHDDTLVAPPRWRLDRFVNSDFDRGRGRLGELLWLIIGGLLVSSSLPGSKHRVFALRAFGARIGKGVVVKPHVRVKFPWRLIVGDHCWIGEDVWIDNLAPVTIGDHSVLSQGAYLCTGSHNWNKETFDLITKPITIGRGTWVCAMARVAPGVNIADGAVVGFGAIATKSMPPNTLLKAGEPKLIAGGTEVVRNAEGDP